MLGNMFFFEDGADGLFPPVAEMRDLEPSGQACHQNTGKAQQCQCRPSPYLRIERIIDRCNCLNHKNLPPAV